MDHVNIVTFDTQNINIKNVSNALEGICMDIWRRTAYDLNITYTINYAKSWNETISYLREDRVDIIVHAVAMGELPEKAREK